MSIVTVTSALFCIGLYGVLTRREIIAILASIEVMLGAANIQLVAYAMANDIAASGQAFALLILVLAAAEAAVGLALLVTMVRRDGRGRVEELMEVDG